MFLNKNLYPKTHFQGKTIRLSRKIHIINALIYCFLKNTCKMYGLVIYVSTSFIYICYFQKLQRQQQLFKKKNQLFDVTYALGP